jgi:hypothetical protein
MSNTNKQSARQLLTELEPGKHLTMYDPKNPSFMMTQCVRVANTYYLAGPQFSVFTGERLPLPFYLGMSGAWELEPLFEASRSDGTTEAQMVELMNGFLSAHGAKPDALVFTCLNLDDTISTIAGLYAIFKR